MYFLYSVVPRRVWVSILFPLLICSSILMRSVFYIPVNTYMHVHIEMLVFSAVRAVTASGHHVAASSDGFYVDNTAPVFDQEIMGGEFYYDVGQGNSTPAEFQNSNNTIKCIWKCDDDESGIVVCIYFPNSYTYRLYKHLKYFCIVNIVSFDMTIHLFE